ncbi:UNVERIFIED_CONTAM: Gamma-cadinene synthase [Sesamum latifolium]|uniref:Gamma-cadinene synthase n=1 Tax=Sesamum latifolium TaxID=2727402 RepID=A0AAW2XZP8_9LAMI
MVATGNVDALTSCPKNVRPPIASFAPTMWADTFTSLSLEDKVQQKYVEAIEALMQEARSMLMAKGKTTTDRLILIDTLERLGVAYHFEQEIEDQLQHIFKSHSKREDDCDLFITALQFRLLRQHRYFVSNKSPLQDQVKRALQHSLHRGVPRIETRHFISFYERDDSKNQLLLKLAKLDFNFLQDLYKKELHELSRDRLVEAYFWGMALHFKPQDSYARVAIAKSVQMVVTLNDTCDSYATLEEADLFIENLDRLHESCLQVLLSIYDDYETEASKQGKSYAVCYAKETMPTFEEYVANMMLTSCVYVILSSTIPAMKSASKETIDWLIDEPKIVAAAAKIGRYLNDLGSYQRENKGGDIPIAVRCYMEQYGMSKEEALDKFVELAEDAWKDFNTEWITETSILARDIVAEQLLNYARAAEVTYENCQDGLTNPEKYLAPQLVALFVDPILI